MPSSPPASATSRAPAPRPWPARASPPPARRPAGRAPLSSTSSSPTAAATAARIAASVHARSRDPARSASAAAASLTPPPPPCPRRLQLDAPGVGRVAAGDGAGDRRHRRPRLEQDLVELVDRVGLHHDRAAGADRRPPRAHHDRADDDAEVHHAVEAEVADRAGVDAARLVLEVVDDLHRAQLRRAGHRAAGEAGPGAARRRCGRPASLPSTVEISWCTVA